VVRVSGPCCSTRDGNSVVAAAQVVTAVSLEVPPSPDADQRLAKLRSPLWGQPQGLARHLRQALSQRPQQLALEAAAVGPTHDGHGEVAVVVPE